MGLARAFYKPSGGFFDIGPFVATLLQLDGFWVFLGLFGACGPYSIFF